MADSVPPSIDTTRETWQRVQEGRCPDAECPGTTALEYDPVQDAREGMGVVRCDTCNRRWAVYLSATAHGVEALPS